MKRWQAKHRKRQKRCYKKGRLKNRKRDKKEKAAEIMVDG